MASKPDTNTKSGPSPQATRVRRPRPPKLEERTTNTNVTDTATDPCGPLPPLTLRRFAQHNTWLCGYVMEGL